MWGARNYNSVSKLSPEERWVQVQINFRLPQQRQSILNEDASKMLLKGPKVSLTHTYTHQPTQQLKQFVRKKKPLLKLHSRSKAVSMLTWYSLWLFVFLLLPHPPTTSLYNHPSLAPLPPPNVSSLSDVSLINSPITSGLYEASLRQPESMSVPLTLKVKVKEEQVVGGNKGWRVILAWQCNTRSTTGIVRLGSFHQANFPDEVRVLTVSAGLKAEQKGGWCPLLTSWL